MRTVSRFEANLLRILHCFLGRVPVSQTLPIIVRREARPPCLSRNAVALAQDVLAKGSVLFLARAGGWRNERFLRGGRPVEGRLWERTSPPQLGLKFSPRSLEFLIWAASADASRTSLQWRRKDACPLSLGDRLLMFLAYGKIRATQLGKHWQRQQAFYECALCRLMYPNDFAQVALERPISFAPWLSEQGANVLEAMQESLVERWLEIERAKGHEMSAARMQSFGQAQSRVLSEFFAAIDQAGRRDLARFVLKAAEQVLAESPSVERWIGSLDVRSLRLADRTAAYEAAMAFLRSLLALQGWQRQALSVGYFDEEYAASQLWKMDWERFRADTLCETARQIIRQTQPI